MMNSRLPLSRRTVLRGARKTLLAALPLLVAPAVLGAQALDVRVFEEGSGVPLPGVILEVYSGTGTDAGQGTLVVAGVTDAAGRRVLPVGAPGSYRVRARRIGFEPFLSGSVTAIAGQAVEVPLRMPARRVTLPAMVVSAAARCDARAVAADAQVAAVWEEVRKALTLSELSRRDGAVSMARMQARAYERHVDAQGADRRLFMHPPQSISSRPFEARAPEDLSDSGYVRRVDGMVEFLAPDERVLLSDEFVQDHCFALTARASADEDAPTGVVGLEFSPAPSRDVPDVAGVIWIDSVTAELRHLDFWFVDRDLPSQARGPGRSGGQVVFARLPDGAWSPVAWRLRMPALEPVEVEGVWPRPSTVRLDLSGWVEIGAVAELPAGEGIAGDGRPAALAQVLAPYLALTRPARVAGVVLDSLLDGAPLAGAHVYLSPARDPEWTEDNASPLTDLARTASLETVTDSAGRFVLDSVAAGYHRLHVSHGALDSAGLAGPERSIRLAPGASEVVTLVVPPRELFESACTSMAGPRVGRRGTLFGAVRRASDGAPLRGVAVTVRWSERQGADGAPPRERSAPTRTGDDGIYRMCDLPLGMGPLVVTVEARTDDAESGPATLLLGDPRDVARRDLVVATAAGEAVVAVAGQLEALRAVAMGRAVDDQGVPVVDATVSLLAPDSTLVARVRTDSIGNFRMLRLPLGGHDIVIQRLGYRMLRQRIALMAGDTTRVIFTMPRSVTTLGAVTITGSSAPRSVALAEVERRRHQGFGKHVTAEEIAMRPTVTSLLNGMSGVHLVTNVKDGMPGLFPGDGGPGHWVAAVNRVSRHNGRLFRECALALYVDGMRWSYMDLMPMGTDDLAAVEVYTQVSQLPDYLQPTDGACGAVLVWTVQAP